MEAPPLLVVGWGMLAGLAGTIVISLLSHLWMPREQEEQPQMEIESGPNPMHVTPAGALAKKWGPGPEGAAELFALKLASGLFNRDISGFLKLAGKAVHVLYGSFWGMVYGLIQATYSMAPLFLGAIVGLAVWAVGPAFLVPAMKLMRSPRRQPLFDRSMYIFGHVIYGITVAMVFEWLGGNVA